MNLSNGLGSNEVIRSNEHSQIATLLSGIQDHPQISDHTEKKSKKNKRPHLNKRPGGIFLKLVKSDQIEIIDHTFEKT